MPYLLKYIYINCISIQHTTWLDGFNYVSFYYFRLSVVHGTMKRTSSGKTPVVKTAGQSQGQRLSVGPLRVKDDNRRSSTGTRGLCFSLTSVIILIYGNIFHIQLGQGEKFTLFSRYWGGLRPDSPTHPQYCVSIPILFLWQYAGFHSVIYLDDILELVHFKQAGTRA